MVKLLCKLKKLDKMLIKLVSTLYKVKIKVFVTIEKIADNTYLNTIESCQ